MHLLKKHKISSDTEFKVIAIEIYLIFNSGISDQYFLFIFTKWILLAAVIKINYFPF